jgi:phage host-nuclease inhibitor protein Gam
MPSQTVRRTDATVRGTDARAVVTERLRRLCRGRAHLDALNAELEGELMEVRRRHEGAISRLQRRVDSMLGELEAYCRAEADSVLPEGRRSLVTAFGEVSFRRSEPALVIEDGAEGRVCAALRARDMADLVRVQEGVDRRALRRALQEGRLSARELRRIGVELVEQEDAFGCRLGAVGGQRA